LFAGVFAAAIEGRKTTMAQSNVRRMIIREWMSLSRDKRQSDQQARAFTKAALQRHQLPHSRRSAHATVMAWLGPRIGRP
jgi:hypothetical protein